MSGFDAAKWEARLRGADCPVCSEAGPAARRDWRVGELTSGVVLLQDDAAFAGYCILYYRRHVAELSDLSSGERGALIEDVARVARAVERVCHPAKLNYAILGNEVPHLHMHVVPRYPDDGWWGRAIWLRPAEQRRPLEAAQRTGLLARLRNALAE